MDKYERIRFLGQGGFGKVYLYENKTNKEQYAIKIVDLSSMIADDRRLAKAEADVLKELHHPNIVSYVESFEDADGSLCIVTEFCEEGDLLKKMQEQSGTPFDEDKVLDWFIQISVALKYLHGRKIIHRDIKPNNIFVAKDGTVRLGDFGLAKLYQHSCALAKTTGIVGTIGFSAPEMCEDDEYTNKCDIWSLGCVLYCLLALKLPFESRNLPRTITLVANGQYGPLPTSVSSNMRQMVSRMLNVDPQERPTISQVLDTDCIKERAQPQQRLKSVYGYNISNGVMLDTQGNGFKWDMYPTRRDNNNRYEGIAEANTDPDYDSPGSFIFATKNWQECGQLVILIHGSGRVKAGQWTRSLMINQSLNKGTQLPYIKRARDCGYGVIVLNTNDTRPDIEGCKSPKDHGVYVWRHYIKKSKAKKIAIKAHSAGGDITVCLVSKFEEDFKKRVYAHAFTGDSELLFRNAEAAYISQVTKNWLINSQPLGTVLPSTVSPCVSAGTPKHEETPYRVHNAVFQFIEEKFRDSTPGNL